MTEQAINAIWVVLFIISIIFFIPHAEKKNKILLEKNSNLQPYKWGYFLGYFGVFTYLGTSIVVLIYYIFTKSDEALLEGIVTAVLLYLFAIPFYFTIKRKKWALILSTVFTLSPIVYIASIWYIKKRWHEDRFLPTLDATRDSPTSFKIFGWIEVASSILALFILLIIYLLVFLSKEKVGIEGHMVMFVVIIFFVINILTGVLLTKGNETARDFTAILSVLRILVIPIGTIWGGLAIYYLIFSRKAKEFFSEKTELSPLPSD